MATNAYWQARYNAATGMFGCPWCNRELKVKMSTSAKNPNRPFVSCNKDFQGCGLFSFTDDTPNEAFNPNKKQGQKRAKTETQGTNIVGPVANQPGVHEQRLAELAFEMGALKAALVSLEAEVIKTREAANETLDYLKQ